MTQMAEEALEPDLPVIDAHHHLFDRAEGVVERVTGLRRFMVEEYVSMTETGHNVVATVACEAPGMGRASGPEHARSVGESEFLAGMAAMAETGRYGATRVAVGFATSGDLTVGGDFRAVLEAHLAVAPDRFKGVRQLGLWDSDDSILGSLGEVENFYGQPRFRQGFAELAKLDLSFDALVLAPQLGDVVDLAQAFPETRIVVNHLGEPVGVGRHSGRREEEFSEWRADMAALSRCSNVAVKVGGIGSFLQGFDFVNADPPASSETLAAAWRPYAESAVELFGAERCMFESNVPADKAGPFNNVCNAYKRIFSGCSASEKRLFFAETAVRVYRLPDSLLAEAGGE